MQGHRGWDFACSVLHGEGNDEQPEADGGRQCAGRFADADMCKAGQQQVKQYPRIRQIADGDVEPRKDGDDGGNLHRRQKRHKVCRVTEAGYRLPHPVGFDDVGDCRRQIEQEEKGCCDPVDVE